MIVAAVLIHQEDVLMLLIATRCGISLTEVRIKMSRKGGVIDSLCRYGGVAISA